MRHITTTVLCPSHVTATLSLKMRKLFLLPLFLSYLTSNMPRNVLAVFEVYPEFYCLSLLTARALVQATIILLGRHYHLSHVTAVRSCFASLPPAVHSQLLGSWIMSLLHETCSNSISCRENARDLTMAYKAPYPLYL
jgi:hypothetical protein